MYKVICKNKLGVNFKTLFDSPYLMRKFVNKAKRGSNVTILGVVKK